MTKPNIKHVLLSFNGAQDPFRMAKGSDKGESKDGPILTLLGERHDFTTVILLFTTQLAERVEQTKAIIKERHPGIEVITAELGFDDPTNYGDILTTLRPKLREFCPPDRSSEYFISVASGTSQMHACWLLLAASGEIPARIIHIRERQYVGEDQPLITEINPRQPEFPHVSPKITMEELPEITEEQMEEAISEVGIFGRDPGILKALQDAAQAAQYDRVSILILGETGTGKELLARYIHRIGKRRERQMIPVNCGAIAEKLIESELFGYVKGAFTGAYENKPGYFDAAHEGVLFLDEIGEMPMSAQVMLLRALDNQEIMSVGAAIPHEVEVQLIAGTNRDLLKALEEGTFRKDLYYRLADMTITLPSLDERRGDIPEIAIKLLKDTNKAFNRNKDLSQNALAFLQNRTWPGNIRELKNVIRRAVITCRDDIIESKDLEDTAVSGIHDGFKAPS